MLRLILGGSLVALLSSIAWFAAQEKRVAVDWHLFPEPTRTVEVQPVTNRPITQRIQAPGRLEFAVQTRIQPPFSATVKQVLVKEDQPVKAGQVLILLDDSTFQDALKTLSRQRDSIREMYDNAREQFSQIESQVAQLESAYPAPNPAPPELTSLRMQLEKIRQQAERLRLDFQGSEASIKSYQKTIERCSIKAPHSGVITQVNIQPGDIAGTSSGAFPPLMAPAGFGETPSTALVTLAQTEKLIAKVWVDESDVADVNTGQLAKVSILDYQLQGKVSKVASVGKRQAESIAFETEIELEVPSSIMNRLRAGMSVMAEVSVESRSSTLSVAVQAVVQRRARDVKSESANYGMILTSNSSPQHNSQILPETSNGSPDMASHGTQAISGRKTSNRDPMRFLRVVYLLRNGRSMAVPVEVGLSDENHVEITHGLQAGDQVIVGPYHELDRLLDDVPVETTSPKPEISKPDDRLVRNSASETAKGATR